MAGLAAWMDLGSLHAYQHADSLLPVLVSLQRWTPFFWGQDRFGMLVPLLALPVRDPLANLLAQGWMMISAALLAPFVVARFITGRSDEWTTIGALTNLWCVLLTPPAVQFDWFVAQPYALSMCLGFGALIIADDGAGLRKNLLAFALLALACWVNVGIVVLLFIATIVRGPRPLRLLTLETSAAAIGLLFARYAATDHTLASLTPPARWPGGWLQLIENSTGVFASGIVAVCAAAVVATLAVWLWRTAGLTSWKRAALILAMAAAPWLVGGTSLWVEMNGYVFRYMYPTLMMVGVGASAVLAALFAMRSNELAVVALAALTTVAGVGAGTPSLARIERRLDDRMGAPVRAALQRGVTVIGGDYWQVWPAVYYANLVLVRSHSQTRVFGLTYRSEATDALWKTGGAPLLIATPPHDASVATMCEQHGVAVTLLAHLEGFDLYTVR
jgi:hypothetical protein